MKLNIKYNNLLDIINLYFGSYRPLNNFISKEDFLSIVNNYHTKNNIFFPLPIYIDISSKFYSKAKHSKIINAFFKSKKVCDLHVKSFFKIDKKKIGRKIFNTRDLKHPGFKEFLNTYDYFIHCKIKKFNRKIMKNLNFSYPSKFRYKFSKNKLKTIVGFHTRNAPHKSHEWIHAYGLSKCDALLIHPLIGQFKKNEYTEKSVIETNYKLVQEIYKNKNIFFGLLNTYPRYAGPREALFHAMVRKNYGCTHFLVGRDHAGIRKYYGKYESQKKCLKFRKKLKIKIISFNEPYLCIVCKKVVNKKCNLCEKNLKHKINGTSIRKMLLINKKIPNYIMRKEIADMLNQKSIILK